MFRRLLDWIGSVTVERNRRPGQSCRSCRYFIDYTGPDDPFGYCGHLVATLGLEQAIKINEYGGHWAHEGEWCSAWEGGDPVWRSDEPESVGAGNA